MSESWFDERLQNELDAALDINRAEEPQQSTEGRGHGSRERAYYGDDFEENVRARLRRDEVEPCLLADNESLKTRSLRLRSELDDALAALSALCDATAALVPAAEEALRYLEPHRHDYREYRDTWEALRASLTLVIQARAALVEGEGDGPGLRPAAAPSHPEPWPYCEVCGVLADLHESPAPHGCGEAARKAGA